MHEGFPRLPLLFGICIIKMFGLGWFRLTLNSLLSSGDGEAEETQRGVGVLLSSSASDIKAQSLILEKEFIHQRLVLCARVRARGGGVGVALNI